MSYDSDAARPSAKVYIAAVILPIMGGLGLATGQTLPGILILLMGIACVTLIAQRHGRFRHATGDRIVLACLGSAMLLLVYMGVIAFLARNA